MYEFFPNKNLHFLSGWGFCPHPLEDMSAMNVSFFGGRLLLSSRKIMSLEIPSQMFSLTIWNNKISSLVVENCILLKGKSRKFNNSNDACLAFFDVVSDYCRIVYYAFHICVPNSWYIYLHYLSCERAQRYQMFGTQIWMYSILC